MSNRPTSRVSVHCGIVALSATLALVCGACGSSPASKTNQASKAKSSASALSFAFAGGLTADLDPDTQDTENHARIMASAMGYLIDYKSLPANSTTIGGPTAVVPALATSWKTTPEGIVFTLNLHAKSQYGNDLTAKDVQWSFQRGVALSGFYGGSLTDVGFNVKDIVTILSPGTIRVNAEKPGSLAPSAIGYIADQPPLSVLDYTEAQKYVTAKDRWATTWMNTHTASFGPYEAGTFVPNVRLTLKANPYYSGPAPATKTINIIGETDSSTVVELLRDGQVEGASGLPDADLNQFKSSTKDKLVLSPQENVDYLSLNKEFKPFTNVKVREAISLALDRNSLVSGPYSGIATPAVGIASTSQAGVSEPGELPYDPSEARTLLAQAGYPKGFSTSFSVLPASSGNVDTDALLVYVKEELGAVGIKVSTDSVSDSTTWFDTLEKGNFGMFLSEDQPAVPTELSSMTFFFVPGSIANFQKDNFPTFTSDVSKASELAAVSASNAAFDQALAYFKSEMIDVPLVQTEQGYVLSKNVCGFVPSAREVLTFANLYTCSG